MSQTSKSLHSYVTGLVLVGVGLALLILVFYEALTTFFATQSPSAFQGKFGGALGYLNSLTTSSGLGQLGVYADVIIVLLIMAVFLGIALAAASVIIGKGIDLLRS